MTLTDFNRLLAPIVNRLRNVTRRAVVTQIDDSTKRQRLQLEALSGEVLSGVEHWQPYGFTSVPAAPDKDNPEALVVRLGSNATTSVAIMVEDRRYRLASLAAGEVALYDATGTTFVMKASGDVEVTPSSGKFKVNGDIEATGDVVANGVSLENHEHEVGGPATNASISITSSPASSGSPVTASSTGVPASGTITGKTGKPA
ncbi:MAG: phage baseplate assembly protein [Myxococcaceae bacterium]